MWDTYRNSIAGIAGQAWNLVFGEPSRHSRQGSTANPGASTTQGAQIVSGAPSGNEAAAAIPKAIPSRAVTLAGTDSGNSSEPTEKGQYRSYPKPGSEVPVSRTRHAKNSGQQPLPHNTLHTFAGNQTNFQQAVATLRREIPGIPVAERFYPDETRQMFLHDLQAVVNLHKQHPETYDCQYLQNFRRCMYYAVRSVPPGETKPFTRGRRGIINQNTQCYDNASLQQAVHEYVYDYFLIRPTPQPLSQKEMKVDYASQIAVLNQQLEQTNNTLKVLSRQIKQEEAEESRRRQQSNQENDFLMGFTPVTTDRTWRLRRQVKSDRMARDQLANELEELTRKQIAVSQHSKNCEVRDRYLREYLPGLRESSGREPLLFPDGALEIEALVPMRFHIKDDDIKLGETNWYDQFCDRLDDKHWRAIRMNRHWHIVTLVRNQDDTLDMLNDSQVIRNHTTISKLRDSYRDRGLWKHYGLFWMS